MVVKNVKVKAGSLGGKETVKKYGKEWMRKLAKKRWRKWRKNQKVDILVEKEKNG